MEDMKDAILSSLGDAAQLEQLYRTDRPGFKRAFNSLSPEIRNQPLAAFWNARLNFTREEGISWGNTKELVLVLLTALVAGFIARLPHMLKLDEELFYSRNIGFILFPALITYFAWKNKLPAARIVFIAAATLAGLLYINLLPNNNSSDTLVLACIHLVLFLWSLLGMAFVRRIGQPLRRIGFLEYNGDLVVMTTLIVIAGGIMTGVTIGLFSLIGLNIEEFWFQNIVVFGLPAAPIFGSYLTRTNPQLVGKVSPVIARIFSPLVLVMLVVYLVAMAWLGKDPYNDREFLLVFNGLLIGVMAIIFFSVASFSRGNRYPAETWVLFFLSVVTILVNGIALSAILFRISEWGITPNRAAVLGSNLLILVNLVWVAAQLLRVLRQKTDVTGVGLAIGRFLPVYAAWTVIVTFLFPLLFGFR